PSRPRRGSSVRSAPPRRGRWRSVGSLRSAVVAVPRRCAPSGLPCGLSSSPLRGRLGRFSFARAVAADAYGSSCFWPRPSFRVRRRRATLSHAGKAMPARARVSRVQSDILKYQRSSRLLLRKLPFQRMVRSISNDLDPGSSCKMNPVALQMLQKASEEYARRLFESANRCAMHAKRVTVFPKDLHLARVLSGRQHAPRHAPSAGAFGGGQRGAQALREIRRLQRADGPVIRRHVFVRLLRETAQEEAAAEDRHVRFRREAVAAVQEATEALLVGLFEGATLCAVGARRVTVRRQDFELAERLGGELP
ncbi:unnamed protein product, partial [Prorocentrum cordatum]